MSPGTGFINIYWLYGIVPVALIAIALWVFRPSARERYKVDEKIPFEEDK